MKLSDLTQDELLKASRRLRKALRGLLDNLTFTSPPQSITQEFIDAKREAVDVLDKYS